MTVAVFFGCTFVAFGPALALFVFTIAKDPLRVIVLIAGKANEGLAALSEDGKSPLSVQQMAYVAGLGFGIMSGAFSVVNILAGSVGPGTVGIFHDSQYYFLTSAFMTMAIILLHTFWSVLFFDGFEKRRWWAVVAVISTHLLVSGLTFLNPLYEGSLIPAYLIMVLMGVWAYFTAGGSLQNLQNFFMCLGRQTWMPKI
ncbi:gamma-secretase subunit Aph-1b-like isoform X3 [Hypanus sabinus]|uniref:gamma-secretase subunit Aph-1b-like isoform X3 n=1 Tax=Hypanus sabinus TaxID=79690 RepID=UPI0028C4EA5A|nr:gamma-secretase subunit Aph-1b-like isoform X3 [Hypanus sabinus]